ncbi:hypothetical protein GCM10011581_41620 [Saccharopolyspora subtropica]|uniref:Subtilisin inhibitor domain-containing protein n=1 Tax=Saccharopolyspora thermophila TaxID=89367 RepID=A0A917K4W7_9PSEU|nr:SSI family serine proteinase inhibitor [Saccharopolyspora subtropica]GGJ00152.1 hypothetical protein GCM10011581_41620 [Saccharopolyspora subtropica]
MLIRTSIAATVILGTALFPAAATAAPADDSSVLHLTLTTRSETRTALLTCHPAGGTHAHASLACDQLDAVDGDFRRMAPNARVCTMEYDPVTVKAEGRWKGNPFSAEETFSNPCTMKAKTSAVFEF